MRAFNDNPKRRPDSTSGSLPFPADPAACCEIHTRDERRFDLACLPDSAGQAIEAIDDMSRRLDDLARELRCLGHFDDDDDNPRAA